MAEFKVNPDHVRVFTDQKAVAAWFKKYARKEDEIWVKVHKKGSGLPSVTTDQVLDVALCWGWIDAIRKGLNETSFLQRYTPRTKTSIWSKKNTGNVARLIKAGLMTEFGQAEIDKAKADGRWARAYGSGAKLETPPELLAAIKAEPKAQALYDKLSAQNRFALAFRLLQLKTPAGREKKIATFVEMLKRGETIYPNGKAK